MILLHVLCWSPFDVDSLFSDLASIVCKHKIESSLLRPCPRLDLFRRNRMQHHFIRRLRSVMCIALAPIIGNSICKDIPGPREAGRADCAPNARVPLQSVFSVLVPEVEGSVTAGGAKGAVLRVEGDGVHGVDITDIIGCARARGLAVAFEGEVGGGVFVFDVLDGAAAFNAADCEAHGVYEAADDSCLVFEG